MATYSITPYKPKPITGGYDPNRFAPKTGQSYGTNQARTQSVGQPIGLDGRPVQTGGGGYSNPSSWNLPTTQSQNPYSGYSYGGGYSTQGGFSTPTPVAPPRYMPTPFQYNYTPPPTRTSMRTGGDKSPYPGSPSTTPPPHPATPYSPTPYNYGGGNIPSPPWGNQWPTSPTPGGNPQTWFQRPYDPGQPGTNPWSNLSQEEFDRSLNYYNSMLPWDQARRNSLQWLAEYGEANRRFDVQNQWQQAMDQYNMGLTGRQQSFAEWQANEAARQWAAQFGWTQQGDIFNQNLSTRQQDAYERFKEQELAMNWGQFQRDDAWRREQWGGDDAWRRYQLAQQMGLSREQMGSEDAWRRYQLGEQLGFSREELASEDAWRRAQAQNFANQYDLGQRELGLQQQRYGWENDLQNRRLGLDTHLGNRQLDLTQHRYNQEAAVARERMQAEQQMQAGRDAAEMDRLRQQLQGSREMQQYGAEEEYRRLMAQLGSQQEMQRYGLGAEMDQLQYRSGQEMQRLQAELASRQALQSGQLGYERERLAQEMGISGRQLDLQEWLNQQQMQLEQQRFGLSQRELEQEAALARERMQQELLISRYQNYGRAQAPNANWVRNWT